MGTKLHAVGCEKHPTFDVEGVLYRRTDIKDRRGNEVGTAKFWSENTFMQAALDDGVDEEEAQKEGVRELAKALKEGWIAKVTDADEELPQIKAWRKNNQ